MLERRREGSEERVTDGRPTEGASKGQPAGGQPGHDMRAEPHANIAYPAIQRRFQRHGRRPASSDGGRLLLEETAFVQERETRRVAIERERERESRGDDPFQMAFHLSNP